MNEESTFRQSSSESISRPHVEGVGELELTSLRTKHSFGYNCTLRNNLHVLDSKTLLFLTGNLIHFLDTDAGSLSFRQSANGCGISCLAVHPKSPIFAVAERGTSPVIILYSWPKIKPISILRYGTTHSYSCITFSTCGNFLASQGDSPDCNLTLWSWADETKVAEKQSPASNHSQIVFAFENYSRITTCGLGHITFWNLIGRDINGSQTSEQLGERLRATEGCFMMTDIASIESVVETAVAGKVISSCHWGNLLVWEDGHIQLEVSRKDGSTCHEGEINQLVAEEGELITIGCDGWIRVWDLESIFNAKAIDTEADKALFHLDPMNEVKVEVGAVLKTIVKSKCSAEDQNDWFIQDSSGSIWKVDLSFSLSMQKPSRIYRCHAGEVTSLTGSPVNSLMLSGGADGKACIYDLNRRTMVNHVKYNSSVTCITWLPIEIDPSGIQVILGYADGVVRLFAIETESDINISSGNIYKLTKALQARFRLIHAVKPHTDRVQRVITNGEHSLVVTLSEDATIFFFKFESTDTSVNFQPIRSIHIPGRSVNIQFLLSNKLLVSFVDGNVWFLSLTDQFLNPDDELVSFVATSIQYSEDRLKISNDSFESEDGQDEMECPDLTIEEVLHAQCLDKDPNYYVAFVKVKEFDKTLVVHCDINNMSSPKKLILPEALAKTGETGSISRVLFWPDDAFIFIGFSNGLFRIHSLNNPSGRNEAPFDPDEWNLDHFWTFSMQNPEFGAVTDIFPIETIKGQMLITSGQDGSIILHQVHDLFDPYIERLKSRRHIETEEKIRLADEKLKRPSVDAQAKSKSRLTWSEAAFTAAIADEKARRYILELKRESRKRALFQQSILPEHVQDIEDPNHLSLEDEKRRTAEEKHVKIVEENKLKIQRHLAAMKVKFKILQQRNEELPRDFRLCDEVFQMTTFTYDDIRKTTEEKLNLVRMDTDKATEESKLALERIRKRFFDDILCPKMIVKGIRSKQELSSFRIGRNQQFNLDFKVEKDLRSTSSRAYLNTLGTDIEELDSDSEKQGLADQKLDTVDLDKSEEISSMATHSRSRQMDSTKLDTKIVKALKKQEIKREKRTQRKKEWQELHARKPREGEEDPFLMEEIREARENMGKYIRKTSIQYEDSVVIKTIDYKNDLIRLMQEIKRQKETFNVEVKEMKRRKATLLEELDETSRVLIDVQFKLDAGKRKPVPTIPIIYPEEMDKDPFEIDEKEVNNIKINLRQEEEEQAYLAGDRHRSMSSRRSSMSSQHSRLKGAGGKMGRQNKQEGKETASQQHAAKKRQRESDRMQALVDVSKLGNLGTLAAWALEEGDEEGKQEEIEEEFHTTETEIEKQNAIDLRLQTDQNVMIKHMEDSIRSFDSDLLLVIQKKRDLAVRLKYAELTIISMYEELQVIRATQETEEELKLQANELKKAVAEIENEVKSKEQQLIKRSKVVQTSNDQLKSLQELVETELADNKHSEYLLRLFASRELFTSDKSKNADSSKIDKDGKMPGPKSRMHNPSKLDELKIELKAGIGGMKHPDDVDLETLKFVLDLKSKRDAIEARVRDEELAIVNLTRELSQAKSERTHQRNRYEEAVSVLQNFRVLKRKRLNSLTTVISLLREQLKIQSMMWHQGTQKSDATIAAAIADASKARQSVSLVKTGKDSKPETPMPNAMPTESGLSGALSSADDYEDLTLLVFSEENLKTLQRRIEELKAERFQQKNKFKEDRQAYFNLQSDCRQFMQKIQVLDSQCKVEMIKRFGESVTMQDIESFAVNRTLEEMKEHARKKERDLYKEISLTEESNKTHQSNLTSKIREVTCILDLKTTFLSEMKIWTMKIVRDDERLKKAQEKLESDVTNSNELNQLIQVYKEQEKEIQAMKSKLSRFMIKGVPVFVQGSPGDPTVIGFGPFEQTKYYRSATLTRSKHRVKSARLASRQSFLRDEKETLILPSKPMPQMKLPEVAIDVSAS